MFFYLIEYVEARPAPVYVAGKDSAWHWTVDPHAAMRFESKDAAEKYMTQYSYTKPWTPIEPGFGPDAAAAGRRKD